MTQEITRTERSTPTRQFTVLLSPTRRGARLARLFATAHLGDWGFPRSRPRTCRARGRADGLLLVLEMRGIAVSDEFREKITSCNDPQLLHQWLNRATTAATAEGVFAWE
ncbi:hypothetical protein ACFU8Q_33920 [Streptomyces sp. NPDC057543]|uniref:hypothetical protein n=1 Tax=Streptomyces sp. NPDC057543 TaxID=3346163 RepID=UPI0036C0479A